MAARGGIPAGSVRLLPPDAPDRLVYPRVALYGWRLRSGKR